VSPARALAGAWVFLCASAGSLASQTTYSGACADSLAPSAFAADRCLEEADKLSATSAAADTRRAIPLALQASRLARRARHHVAEGRALLAVARNYRTLMQFDSVLHYAGQAAALGTQRNDMALEATAYTMQGMVYALLGRADSAFWYMNEVSHRCAAPCEMAVPLLALVSRFYPDSNRGAMLDALELRTRGAPPSIRGRVVDELGFYAGELQGDHAKALEYHRSVIAMKGMDEWTLFGLVRAFRGLRMTDSAVHYVQIQRALAHHTGAGWLEAYALGNIAQLCHRDLPTPRLDCALAYYDSTAQMVVRLLGDVGADDNRTTVADYAAEIYEDLILAMLAYESVVGKERAEIGSLIVSEFGRALGLRRYLENEPQPSLAVRMGPSAPRDSLEFLRALDSTTFTLSYHVGEDTTIVWLTRPGMKVSMVRTAIPRDTVLALVNEVREELGVDYQVVESRLRGAGQVNRRRQTRQVVPQRISLRRVSALLVPGELLEQVPKDADLVIVPHYTLASLPFGVLQVPEGELGSAYAVRYAPSLKVLASIQAARRSRSVLNSMGRSVVVSNPRMPTVDLGAILEGIPEGAAPLSSLPGSADEGRWVASRLGTTNLTGGTATETRVRAALRSADVVHFATHAIAAEYAGHGRRSFLATAPDSVNDGLLTAGELLDMPAGTVAAKLVVLSACQTAIGPMQLVEGTIGLQRAFLAKGAESVLASLWSVNDESTRLLMRHFYTHLLDDGDRPSRAEALRRAQADVRRVPGYEDPVYWAGFQLIGLN
jgi:CHAT domain-containing protein